MIGYGCENAWSPHGFRFENNHSQALRSWAYSSWIRLSALDQIERLTRLITFPAQRLSRLSHLRLISARPAHLSPRESARPFAAWWQAPKPMANADPMPMTMIEVTRLKYAGISWEVQKSAQIEAGGQIFVKLPRANSSRFAKMCLKDAPEGALMMGSEGYAELCDLRDARQAELMKDDKAQEQPRVVQMLFRVAPVADENNPKRPRVAREAMRQMRACPDTLDITIPAFDDVPPTQLTVLRPVHSRDDLAVPLNPAVIQRLILYFSHAGFSAGRMRAPRDPRIPKGVYARRKRNGEVFYIQRQEDGQSHRVVSLGCAGTVDGVGGMGEAGGMGERDEADDIDEANGLNDSGMEDDGSVQEEGDPCVEYF